MTLEPLPPHDWDRSKARHLAARAGFGGRVREIDLLTDLGLDAAVESFLRFPATPSDDAPDWTSETGEDLFARMREYRSMGEEQRQMARRERLRDFRRRSIELGGWWIERMLSTPHPLQEKLTLFWHGHFATSAQKVRNPQLMWQQNETFRRLAGGSWPEMVQAMAQDPAMLVWLDGVNSTKQQPNENFARELMELFTLGEGHYTEEDIKEAARAFTGYTLARDRSTFQFREEMHDGGRKSFMGRQGNFDGEAIIQIILEKPEADRYITGKLWHFFTGATEIDPRFHQEMAELFRRSGRRIAPWLGVVFRSRAFYDPTIVASQIKSPVQWMVSLLQSVERPVPHFAICQRILSDLGQIPFYPPNVKGWDDGPAWITVSSLTARFEHARNLVEGGAISIGNNRNREGARFRPEIPPAPARDWLEGLDGLEPNLLCEALESRFLAVPLKPERRNEIVAMLGNRTDMTTQREAVAAIVASPEFQLA